MLYYYLDFVKKKTQSNSSLSNEYIFILNSLYKGIINGQFKRLSNYINEDLKKYSLDDQIKFNSEINQKMKELNSISTNNANSPIKSILFKNFRGFGDKGNSNDGYFIELHGKRNIFYAPNGGGKSSFCEAFEFALTGQVKECLKRGIDKFTDYVMHYNNKPEISIEFLNSDINMQNLSMKEKNDFKRHFIEKNRIQEFATFKSKDTNTDENDVISVIVGLEEINDLMNSLVKNLNISKLHNEVEKIAYDKIEIEFNNIKEKYIAEKKNIKEVENEVKSLLELDEFDPVISKLKLNKLKAKRSHLNNLISNRNRYNIVEHKPTDIKTVIKNIEDFIDQYLEVQDKLASKAVDINLELYNAINKIENKELTYCPACLTPIESVTINPIKHAREQLENLKDIQELDNRLKKLKTFYNTDLLQEIENNIKKIDKNYQLLNFELETIYSPRINSININLLNDIKVFLLQVKENKNYFKSIKKMLYEQENINSIIEQKDNLMKKITIIEEKFQDIDKREKYIFSLKYQKKKITIKLEEQEKKANREKLKNQFYTNISEEYKHLYNELYNYKISLEMEAVKNIEENVVKYYSQLNKHDTGEEKITDVKFDLINESNNNKIILTTESGKKISALKCLSEGHIRTLGLSIIFSIAQRDNIKFLIFDDVINAIDMEHRNNIIEILAKNNGYLSKTQIIITTHDRMFWEKFCNSVSEANMSYYSSIITKDNNNLVIKNYKLDFKSKILEAIENYDIKKALAYSRIWFENIAKNFCKTNGKKITSKFLQMID